MSFTDACFEGLDSLGRMSATSSDVAGGIDKPPSSRLVVERVVGISRYCRLKQRCVETRMDCKLTMLKVGCGNRGMLRLDSLEARCVAV